MPKWCPAISPKDFGRPAGFLERQVSHMERLVDDLLDVSRITSGKIELRREPLEAASFIRRALEMSRPLLEQSWSRSRSAAFWSTAIPYASRR